MPSSFGKHAVVVGAGIGGLAAAKALSDHFDKVTILDRDALPAEPEPRSGTPQSRHPHALLTGGQEALAELFPGFAEDIERAGAVRVRNGLDIWWERPGFDPFPVRDLGYDSFCLSRPLLEFVIRRRIELQGNVVLLPLCRAIEFVPSPDQTAVTGVQYEDADGRTSTLVSDLVLDASGRGALTLAFLAAIGATELQETEIGIDIGYSTAIFEIPKEPPLPWKGLLHLPLPPDSSRGAIMLPIEHQRWMVALGGAHGDAPPGDVEGYMAFAKSLRTSTVYDAIKHARRVGEIIRFKFAEQRTAPLRADATFSARPASDRRRGVPLQPGLWPRYERRGPGGLCARSSPETTKQLLPIRLMDWRPHFSRHPGLAGCTLGCRRERLHLSADPRPASGGFRGTHSIWALPCRDWRRKTPRYTRCRGGQQPAEVTERTSRAGTCRSGHATDARLCMISRARYLMITNGGRSLQFSGKSAAAELSGFAGLSRNEPATQRRSRSRIAGLKDSGRRPLRYAPHASSRQERCTNYPARKNSGPHQRRA